MNDPSSFLSFGAEEPNEPPETPSDPDPYDGETDVDINADLSWTCSDPDGDDIVYDVYFEAEDPTPDVLVSDDQPENTYDPGTMDVNTMYYWQIVAKDEHDATTDGPIWSFSTETNDPPISPSDPEPYDGENGVSVNADISWTCIDPNGDEIVYDVFFEAEDPTPDILVSDDQPENTYDPGTMELGTTYYWRIIAKDEHDATTDGPIWSFTTRTNNSPSAPVIDGPIEGKPGISYTYTFVSTDPEGDDVWYYIDWGDGNYEDWFGPHPSGTIIEKTHVFDNTGTYIIYAKAKDTLGSESDWGTLTVTIPRGKVLNNPIMNFLQNQPNMFPLLQQLLVRFGL
jgi:hypothetical protein